MVVTGMPKKALIICLMFACVLSGCRSDNENLQSNDTISLSSSQQGKLATGTVECLLRSQVLSIPEKIYSIILTLIHNTRSHYVQREIVHILTKNVMHG